MEKGGENMEDTKESIPISKQGSPLAAGITGLIIGAGVAVVTTRALSDKKTRGKIMESISDTRDKISDFINQAKKEAIEKKEMAEHRIRIGSRKMRRKMAKSR